jgi:phosphoadenosine phosphosulfate reductase
LYSYTYDQETGGILLNLSPTKFSKEPRPVYARELDLLGFNNYWNYDKQMDLPYMWAEANKYYYRGQLVAKLKGGNLYNAPEIIIPTDESGKQVTPEPNGTPLRTVEVESMVRKNRVILDILEDTTVKKIIDVYKKYKDKLDIFHVAFSGGKDSLVLLDLVKKALPHGSFVIVFGDTGMEFPDTYDVIEKTRKECETEGMAFYTARSHLKPEESWKLFGPPSRTLRWCCSVHKSAPQTLKLREVTGKSDYKGLAFVGVRAYESATRAEYKYENYGIKQKGQYSHNSILEWTAAEVWSYILANNLMISEAYKKGSARVGCLFCPMGGGKSKYIEYINYKEDIDPYLEIIKQTNGRERASAHELVLSGGWSARKNGRDLLGNLIRCIDFEEKDKLRIEITNPKSDWREWIQTLGIFNIQGNEVTVLIEGKTIIFNLNQTKTGYSIIINGKLLQERPYFKKLLRQVFYKSAYCVGCRVCEANCRSKAIRFIEVGNKSVVNIINCIQCHECHSIEKGCISYHSLRHPYGGGKPMKSLNTFSNHAPKTEWLTDFFVSKSEFFRDHRLGPEQISFFKRFLKDANLAIKNQSTPFANIIEGIGWDTEVAQGLILVNLAYENPQIAWYLHNLSVGKYYNRKLVEEMLIADNVKPPVAKSIISAYKRLTETPLGTRLNFGHVTDDGDLIRTTCNISEPLVILYALYKFAEKCNNYKEFTLAALLNDAIDRDGVSPTRIFGLGREVMTPLLLGLTAKYPEFINATFTHDMEKIVLSEEKKSDDVLQLFKGGR